MKITMIGLDITKSVFQAHSTDVKPAEICIGNYGMDCLISCAGQEYSSCCRKHFSAATFVGGASLAGVMAAATGLALHGSLPMNRILDTRVVP